MRSLFLIAFFLVANFTFAQPYKTIKPYKPYKWMIGVHWSAIEDDGDKFNGLFDVNNSWNIKPFPTKLTLDRYLTYGWSLEGVLSYGEYTEEKRVNDTTGITGVIASFDFNGKYSLYNLYAPRARWIEPYFIAGVGYTYRNGTASEHVPTVNLGGGLNIWFIKQLGLQISSNAKLGMWPGVWDENSSSNYFQHSVGLVFRTPDKAKYKNPNKKAQHKWTKKRQRGFKRKGGH